MSVSPNNTADHSVSPFFHSSLERKVNRMRKCLLQVNSLSTDKITSLWYIAYTGHPAAPGRCARDLGAG